MKRIHVLGLCIMMAMTFIVGCTEDSKDADTPPTTDQAASDQAKKTQMNLPNP